MIEDSQIKDSLKLKILYRIYLIKEEDDQRFSNRRFSQIEDSLSNLSHKKKKVQTTIKPTSSSEVFKLQNTEQEK